jgi:hypothetical protein
MVVLFTSTIVKEFATTFLQYIQQKSMTGIEEQLSEVIYIQMLLIIIGPVNTLNTYSLCRDFGQCNNANYKFDTIKLLCSFSKLINTRHRNSSSPLWTFITDCISLDFLNYIHRSNDYCLSASPQGKQSFNLSF